VVTISDPVQVGFHKGVRHVWRRSVIDGTSDRPNFDVRCAAGPEDLRAFGDGAGGRNDIIHDRDPRTGGQSAGCEGAKQIGPALPSVQLNLRSGAADSS